MTRDCDIQCTMPAGEYYIGDLCYVMDEVWDEVCDLFFDRNSPYGCNQGKFKLKDGREFVSFNTRYGDGVYYDQTRMNEYGVDAGLIGCIKVSDIRDRLPSDSVIVRFDQDFHCHSDGSKLRFGHVVIDTDPGDEEEEEYEDEYEEE